MKDQKHIIPWLMACAMFMEKLDESILITSIPKIAQTFQTNPITLKFALTSYLLSLTIFIPISGWLADRFGSQKIFTTAIAVFTIGSILCGLSQSLVSMVVARIIQGIGGAMMIPVARLILIRSFDKSELLQATNYVTIPSLLGPVLGPLLGGAITSHASWRWIFYINVPFGLLGIFLALRHITNFKDEAIRKMDKLGFLLFASALTGFSFGFESIGESFLSTQQQMSCIALSCLLFVLYLLDARGKKNYFLKISLFKIGTFRTTVLGSIITRLGIGGIPFLLPLMFQMALNYSPFLSGMMMIPLASGMITMKFFVRKLLRALGFKQALLINTFFLGLSIACYFFITPQFPLLLIAVMTFLCGCFSSLQFSCMNVLTFIHINKEDLSNATSIASTAQQFSMGFGVAISALSLHSICWMLHNDVKNILIYKLSFLLLGMITTLSTLLFKTLKDDDGAEASGHQPGLLPS